MDEIHLKKVLEDFREGDKYNTHLSGDPKWSDYSQRLDIYNNLKCKGDADHWKRALDSYREYPAFSKGYNFERDQKLTYSNNGECFYLTADLLTNAATISERIKKIREKGSSPIEDAIFDAFFRVSYTCGNFCPIWKNSGFGQYQWNDNIWKKLKKSGLYDEEEEVIYEEVPGIDVRADRNVTNSNKRTINNLFMVLPGYNKPSVVLEALYFQDYFDFSWRLRWCDELNVSKMTDDIFIEYVKMLVILIVQRGYRIVASYRGSIFSQARKEDVHTILKELGIENVELIYSEKKRK